MGEFYEFYTSVKLLNKNKQCRKESGRHRQNRFGKTLIIVEAGWWIMKAHFSFPFNPLCIFEIFITKN